MTDKIYGEWQNGEWGIIGEVDGLPVWSYTPPEPVHIEEMTTSVIIEAEVSRETLAILQLAVCGQIFVQHIPFDFGDENE